MNRRELLAGGVVAATALAGCAGLPGTGDDDRPPVGRAPTGVGELTHDEPILPGGPTVESGPAFHAALLTDETDAERVTWPDRPGVETYRTLDYDASFLSVCTTRLDVDRFESAGPGRLVEGTVHYRFDLPGQGGWPVDPEDLHTIVARWDRSAGVADAVSVDIRYDSLG